MAPDWRGCGGSSAEDRWGNRSLKLARRAEEGRRRGSEVLEREKKRKREREKEERGKCRLDPAPAAFIADRGGRLASKWPTWATSPDLLRRNSSHDRCRYQKLPHHVAHNRIGSGGDIDVTRRTGGRALTTDIKITSAQNFPSEAETWPKLVRKQKLHKYK